jgi:hypothetical protein
MRHIIIKSNQGNQVGFHRTWKLEDEELTLEQAKASLTDIILGGNDNYSIAANGDVVDGNCDDNVVHYADSIYGEYDVYQYQTLSGETEDIRAELLRLDGRKIGRLGDIVEDAGEEMPF